MQYLNSIMSLSPQTFLDENIKNSEIDQLDEILQRESDTEIKKYWTIKSEDARRWCLFFVLINMFFQTADLFKPWSDRHFIVNVVYQIGSIIQLCLLIDSFKNTKRSINQIYVVMVYTTLRQSIYLYDPSHVQHGFYPSDWRFITSLVANQQYGCVVILYMFF